jgi:PAS domain S-box-containing protein
MAESVSENQTAGIKPKILLPIFILMGVLLFVLIYLGIQKSRSDSLELIRQQGTALIESLTLSSDNAIKANSLFDLLVEEKFSDLASFLEGRKSMNYSAEELADLSSQYGVDAIMTFDRNGSFQRAGARGFFINLAELSELASFLVDTFLADTIGDNSRLDFAMAPGGNEVIYFIKISADNSHIIVVMTDALFYTSAKKDIGIGYLVQNIAREVGIEYIMFQTEDGIIFSSRRLGPTLKIENDPFLEAAIDSDTTLSRVYSYNERNIMELVRPFSSVEYPRGLFRMGLSLEKYYSIMGGFDRQMIALSFVIFAVLILIVLYLSGKQKRILLDRSFKKMKSLSEKVFDSINAGLIAINRDGTIEMVNNQFCMIFEITEMELIGKRWSEFPFGKTIPIEEMMAHHQKQGELELQFAVASTSKNLIVNMASLYDGENRETGAVAVIYDYTHIKELEETARRKERLTELGDLAAGVAHEIRNPLNAISIAAQRLLAEFQPQENSEEFKSFAGQIKAEAGRLNEIVTRFLAMTRDRSTGGGRFDASGAVQNAVQFMQLDLANTKIKLHPNVESEIFLTGTPDRFRQLVINLIKNGIEACGGETGEVAVRLYRENKTAIFSVKDNGPGIPNEIKKKIFNPYFTTKDKGTGLGLSIVHQIAEEMKGKTEVLTPASGGTEVKITFQE